MNKKLYDILWENLEELFTHKKKEILQTTTQCQKCGTTNRNMKLSVFLEDDSSLKLAYQNLQEIPKYHIQQALLKTERKYSLNLKNGIVKSIITDFNHLKYQILCLNCEKQEKIKRMWMDLQNPLTPLTQIKRIVKTIVNHGTKEEIVRLREWVSPHISNRIRKIPHPVRNFWIVYPKLIRTLYKRNLTKSAVIKWGHEWIPLLEEGNFITTEIGQSIARAIYKADISELNQEFFPVLYHSKINLFHFFRSFNMTRLNSALLPFLLKIATESNNIAQTLKIQETIQAIIASKKKYYLEDGLALLDKFPETYQELFITELFEYSIHPKFQKYLPTISEIVLKSNRFPSSITHLFSSKLQKFQEEFQQIQKQKETKIKDLQNLNLRIQELHRVWKKKPGPSPYCMSDIKPTLIKQKYQPIIQKHINQYQKEFEQYFQSHDHTLIAFDIEEWHHRVFCILGIQIKSDLSFSIQLIAVEDIYPIHRSHDLLIIKMQEWLESIPEAYVISHGTNQTEENIIKKAGHFQINTQDILHQARYSSPHYSHKLTGEGLKHFEDSISFHRFGCPMLKHGIDGSTFFDLAEVSLDRLLSKNQLSKCTLCHLDQDVLLYCLEDAFSSLLIYLVFANHEEQICSILGYNLFI